jgi:hypothetical protein
MTRAVHRAWIPFVVAFAIAVFPLVLDQCAAACERSRAGLAASSAPSCHHAPSPATRIGHVPNACGHDHHLALTTATDATPVPRALVFGLAVVSGSITVDANLKIRVDARAPDVPPDLDLHASPSPLRI